MMKNEVFSKKAKSAESGALKGVPFRSNLKTNRYLLIH